jgi:acyl carrier protein
MSIDRDLTSALLRLVRELADQLRPGNDFVQVLGIDHSLERDYGLDSLSRAELLTRIESELGVSLEPTALSQAETPHDLLRAIVAAPPSASSPSMPEPARDDFRIEYPPATLDTLVDVLDWHA